MYAIIETGGRQVSIQQGDEVQIEKIPGETGQEYEFNRVLAIVDGDKSVWGTPYLAGSKVRAKIIKHAQSKKIDVLRYKPKVRYRKKYGHRQPYTKIQILEIQRG